MHPIKNLVFKWMLRCAITIAPAASPNDYIVQEQHTGHSVTKSRGPHEGRFTFTSHDAGDHSICLSTNYTAGWFSNSHIRLYLDIVVGSTRPDVEHDRSHVNEVAGKIRDLNQKLEDIRREQQYQREREAAFRDLSESTNMRAVWYIIAEIVVLLVTCTWQLRHLRVGGLIHPKLRRYI
jgi:p24 family protein alpha